MVYLIIKFTDIPQHSHLTLSMLRWVSPCRLARAAMSALLVTAVLSLLSLSLASSGVSEARDEVAEARRLVPGGGDTWHTLI